MNCPANVTILQNITTCEESFFVKVTFTTESRGGKYGPIDPASVLLQYYSPSFLLTTGGKQPTWFPSERLVEHERFLV